MNSATTTGAVSPVRTERRGKVGQGLLVVALLTFVVVLDQVMKWWAWRHASVAIINSGGNPIVGATVGGWYANPMTGALLDLLDFGLLSTAVSFLLRRLLPVTALVPGALIVGGWSSNLLDRLGMHYWTAPGSVRGAVDFIHLGHQYCNVADFFIIGATPLFLLAVGFLCRSAWNRPATIKSVAPTTQRQPRTRARMSVFAGALALIVVVGIGAANYGGVDAAPLVSARASAHH
jgi:lipoprotein signal peptidase